MDLYLIAFAFHHINGLSSFICMSVSLLAHFITPSSSCNVTYCRQFKYIAKWRELKETNRKNRIRGPVVVGSFIFSLPLEFILTCKNSAWLSCHVDLVLPGDLQHHGFGPPVMLGGQQPAQGFGKNPVEGVKEGDGEEKQTKDEQKICKRKKETSEGRRKQEEKETIVCKIGASLCGAVCTVQAIAWLRAVDFLQSAGLTRRMAASVRKD